MSGKTLRPEKIEVPKEVEKPKMKRNTKLFQVIFSLHF